MNEEYGSPQAKADIGLRLEQAREKSGLSLEQVEQSTKIRARYLRELERENFDVLPAVYVLGSLKTYADFLGLDGAALSRELREHLEPKEPEAADDPLAPGEDYEAAPAAAVGFNQLFLGMGVLIVSVLAIMTLVSAVAQNAGPTKVSQVDEPSVQQASQGLDLAGNVNPERNPERDSRSQNSREDPEKGTEERPREVRRGDKASLPKDERDADEGVGASSAESLFGDVEFVPMSPPSSSGSPASGAGASTSASATSATADPAPVVQSAAPSAFPESSDVAPSSVPSDGFSSASPSGGDGDLRPGPEDGEDRVSDRIIADVEKELREAGIDP